MSAQLATASPRRIKASHRRRRKIASGQSVQRYYDPQIGRFLSVDPVGVSPINGLNFNRYWYASNNPYKNRDPDGRCDGPSTCAIDRDIAAMNRGEMSRAEFMERSQARAGGAVIGAGAVLMAMGAWEGASWLVTTKTGREVLFAILSAISRENSSELHKFGRRATREMAAVMKEAKKRAVDTAKQEAKEKPKDPPKPEPPPPPRPPENPKPEPPKPEPPKT